MPVEIKRNLKVYRQAFTKPQFKQFQKLILGLIVSDNKTLQEINDCFGDTNQSSFNRFVTESPWDKEDVNKIMVKQMKPYLEKDNGILIVDPTMLHKTGKHMEYAGYHYSGITKEKEWGHLLVDSLFVSGEIAFPLRGDIYIRKKDCDKEHPFKTSRIICREQIEFAIKNGLPLKIVMADAGLYAHSLIQEIKSYGKRYLMGIRTSNKFSLNNREKRINANSYLNRLTDLDFGRYIIGEDVYHLHVKEIYTRKVGKEKLLISYKDGDEENIKLYTTNLLDYTDEKLMHLLLKRWDIEGLHRDSKQHLGLEDYQLRKYRGIQKVVLAVFVAYTLLVLSAAQKILKPIGAVLRTIGEGCRFFRLVATKSYKWLRRRARNKDKFKEILNRFVFVKNAKV